MILKFTNKGKETPATHSGLQMRAPQRISTPREINMKIEQILYHFLSTRLGGL